MPSEPKKPVGRLLPTINLDAPAGTVVITDGRLLHSTGINHTDRPRIVMLNGMQHPVIRQQENWMLSVSTGRTRRASPKLLQRMGFQATNASQTNEGHGFGASGIIDEPAGATVDFRLAADAGHYLRVGELGPNSSPSNSMRPLPTRRCLQSPSGWTQRAGGYWRRQTQPLTNRESDRARHIVAQTVGQPIPAAL